MVEDKASAGKPTAVAYQSDCYFPAGAWSATAVPMVTRVELEDDSFYERLQTINQDVVNLRELLQEAEEDWPSYERAKLKHNIMVYEDERDRMAREHQKRVDQHLRSTKPLRTLRDEMDWCEAMMSRLERDLQQHPDEHRAETQTLLVGIHAYWRRLLKDFSVSRDSRTCSAEPAPSSETKDAAARKRPSVRRGRRTLRKKKPRKIGTRTTLKSLAKRRRRDNHAPPRSRRSVELGIGKLSSGRSGLIIAF